MVPAVAVASFGPVRNCCRLTSSWDEIPRSAALDAGNILKAFEWLRGTAAATPSDMSLDRMTAVALVALVSGCLSDEVAPRPGPDGQTWAGADLPRWPGADARPTPRVDASPFDEPPAQLRVVQCNPYYAGRLDHYHVNGGSCSSTPGCAASGRVLCSSPGSSDGCWECIDKKCRQRTWETFQHAARLVHAIAADMVGVEELPPVYAPRIEALLEKHTGDTWSFVGSEQGIGGTGSGNSIFWRERTVELVQDFGYATLDTLPSGYHLRFHGGLFRPRGSLHLFGFFAGKLYWDSAAGERRRAEAQELRSWVDAVMAPWEPKGAVSRIVAIDLNDTPGSPAYQVFVPDYDDGGAVKPTIPGRYPDATGGRRIDYLLWDDGQAGTGQQGFVGAKSDGRLGRSEYFGSDHRFVYGDARIL